MFVLDTNTLIYFFKGAGNVSSQLLAKSPSEIGIPSIVVFEIEYGLARLTSAEKRRRQLEEFLSVTALLPFGRVEAIAAADVRAKLEKKGEGIGPFDNLIAGTAIAYNATLVTHNTEEFARIESLKIEDWF